MRPKVSVSLIKKQFLFIQEKFYASKSFGKIYPLKQLLVLETNSLSFSGRFTQVLLYFFPRRLANAKIRLRSLVRALPALKHK